MKKRKKGKKEMEDQIMETEKEQGKDSQEPENDSEIEVEIRHAESSEEEAMQESPSDEKETEEQPQEVSKEKEYFDRLVRLTADFDNYKKRIAKEKQEFLKYSNERLIKEIIPIVDNLERASQSAKTSQEAKSISEGIDLILNQILNLLKREGVEILSSKGESFDPLIHEAISQFPSSEFPPNTVIEEQLKAYLLNKKLIRPARVVVSSEMPAQSEEPKEAEHEQKAPDEATENICQSDEE